MPSINLKFDDFIVRVAAQDADDLSWLAAVLECGFEPVAPTSPSAEVRLTVDAAAYDTLLGRGRTETGPDLEGFAQDSGRYLVEQWSADAESLTVRDPELPGFYRLARSRCAVEILARGHPHACRIALLRVVRELTMDHVVATGGVLIHGAAARSDGGVIVVSGPKRRGKTTLLLSLLEHTDVAYVSNDRCVLGVGDATATLRGLPTLVSITRSGLDAFPGFRQRLFAARPDLAASVAPSVGFGPQQLVRLLPAPRASSGPVAAFLFPRVTSNPERLLLQRLSPAEALAQFREGLFRAGRASVLGDVFASATTLGRSPWEAGEAAGRWISANLPCFLAELGGGGPPTAGECRSLLARIAAAR